MSDNLRFKKNLLETNDPISQIMYQVRLGSAATNTTILSSVLSSIILGAQHADGEFGFEFDVYDAQGTNDAYLNYLVRYNSTQTVKTLNVVTIKDTETVNPQVILNASRLNVDTLSTGTTIGGAGATGSTGATGAAGSNGAAGATGATGAAGTNGTAGATGSTGATGATGSTGITGATGANGFVGVDGTTVWSNFGSTFTVNDSNSRAWKSISSSYDGRYQTAAVQSGAIYVSSDFGTTWTSKTSNFQWYSVSVSESGKYQAAVVNTGYVFVSSDYGNIWVQKGYVTSYLSISISASGQYQTAVSDNDMIYVSSDYGNNWSIKDSQRLWKTVSISASGQYQTATTYGGNIYISSDYGNTWTATSTTLNWLGCSISRSGQYQTAVVDNGYIYISSDYGSTWTSKDSTRAWSSVSISGSGQYQVAILSSSSQIYISSDYGNTWSTTESSRSWGAISISKHAQYITAAVTNGSLYVSQASNIGATGAAGATGATGLVGATGATGLVGATGATGLAGATGATGSAGTNGATGATGAGFTTIANFGANRILISDGTSNAATANSNFTFVNNSTIIVPSISSANISSGTSRIGTLNVFGNTTAGIASIPSTFGPFVISTSAAYGTLQLQSGNAENGIFIKDYQQGANNGWLVGNTTNHTLNASSFCIGRFSSNNAVANTGIFMNSIGNVGIGTSNPQYKLEVISTIAVTESGVGFGQGTVIKLRGLIGSDGYQIEYNNGITTSPDNVAIRFVGTDDSAVPRQFNFGYYTSNNRALAWNQTISINPNTTKVFIGDPAWASTANAADGGRRLDFDNTYNGTVGAGVPANKIRLVNSTSYVAGLGHENGAQTYHVGAFGAHRFYTNANQTTYGVQRVVFQENGFNYFIMNNGSNLTSSVEQQAGLDGSATTGNNCYYVMSIKGGGGTTLRHDVMRQFYDGTDYAVNYANDYLRVYPGSLIGSIGQAPDVAYKLAIRNNVGTGVRGLITGFSSTGNFAFALYEGGAWNFAGWNGNNSVAFITKDNVTSRSINAAGTLNANGADYAEYVEKDVVEDVIVKGEIAGMKSNGKLTKKWSEAKSYLIKTTNPALVGGDAWGDIGKRPEPPTLCEDATEEQKAEYETKKAEYDVAIAEYLAKLEAERVKWDRMAYCGQVPVNIQGAVAGDYIVAVEGENDAITGLAVPKADITFAQYQNAVGRVIKVLEDGRAFVNVIVH